MTESVPGWMELAGTATAPKRTRFSEATGAKSLPAIVIVEPGVADAGWMEVMTGVAGQCGPQRQRIAANT
jgi:hypothetical protein